MFDGNGRAVCQIFFRPRPRVTDSWVEVVFWPSLREEEGERKKEKKRKKREKKTNNTGYSLVVTDPTTNPALTGLTRGERTGSRIFQWVWSFVTGYSNSLL